MHTHLQEKKDEAQITEKGEGKQNEYKEEKVCFLAIFTNNLKTMLLKNNTTQIFLNLYLLIF